jgi:hypothetical protein
MTPLKLRIKYLELLKRNDLTKREVLKHTEFLARYKRQNESWENSLIINKRNN